MKFHPEVRKCDRDISNNMHGCIMAQDVPEIGCQRVVLPAWASVEQKIAEYRMDGSVEWAEPNYLVRKADAANDPYFPVQYGITQTGTVKGWAFTVGDPELIIAVLDTGVDLDHPDLAGQLTKGYDFVNDDDDPDDDEGHGTHVAGIIGARTNNGLGMSGMVWWCKLMPLKVLDRFGAGTHMNVALAVVHAADSGARVINLSLASMADSNVLSEAIDYAYDSAGAVLVAGTGNSGGGVDFPARHPKVLAVGATDDKDEYCDQSKWGPGLASNHGKEVDVAAPGNEILSTYPDDAYAYLSGTSMSTAFVAGLAALLFSGNPELTNIEVMDALRTTALDLLEEGHDEFTGFGRIETYGALDAVIADEGGGGLCFVASAAYGPQAVEVQRLRRFRDEVLMGSSAGREFVGFYYRHGDVPASWIRDHPVLRVLARLALAPVAGAVEGSRPAGDAR